MSFRSFVSLVMSILFGACTLSSDAETPFGGASPSDGTTSSGSGSSGDAGTETPETLETTGTTGSTDVIGGACERLEGCGFLPVGVRPVDCVDSTQMCMEDALQTERADWELVVAQCLQFENCFNFLDCYERLGTCGFGVEVGTTGDVDTPPNTAGNMSDGGSSPEGEGSEGSSTEDEGGGGGSVSCEGPCDTCSQCAFDGPCEVETLSCTSNPTCLDLNDCYGTCDDVACLDLCDAAYPGGVDDLQALYACTTDVCASC